MTEHFPEERVAKLAGVFADGAVDLLNKACDYKTEDGAVPGEKALAVSFAMGLAGAAVSALVAAKITPPLLAASLVGAFAQSAAESIE